MWKLELWLGIHERAERIFGASSSLLSFLWNATCKKVEYDHWGRCKKTLLLPPAETSNFQSSGWFASWLISRSRRIEAIFKNLHAGQPICNTVKSSLNGSNIVWKRNWRDCRRLSLVNNQKFVVICTKALVKLGFLGKYWSCIQLPRYFCRIAGLLAGQVRQLLSTSRLALHFSLLLLFAANELLPFLRVSLHLGFAPFLPLKEAC